MSMLNVRGQYPRLFARLFGASSPIASEPMPRFRHTGSRRAELPTYTLEVIADRLVGEVTTAARRSLNEKSLEHEVEKYLETACVDLGIAWTPYQLNRTLLQPKTKTLRFADAVHGAIVIEYEAPGSFGAREGRQCRHARAQAEEYADLLAREEGRALDRYVLVAWDGSHVTFGAIGATEAVWEPLRAFDAHAARRLLQHLRTDGRPLVSPLLLATYFGPEEPTHGGKLVPLFFRAVVAAATRHDSKTYLLFREWSRLFGQAAGVQSERLRDFLAEQGAAHGAAYSVHPTEYLFALNTYIALVAKLVAAYSLPNAGEDLRNGSVAIRDRVQQIETGELFLAAGVAGLLAGDFFSWYRDDAAWAEFEPAIGRVMEDLALVNFASAQRSPEAIRDLFKRMYQAFVPAEMRHALGEFYTPDWLAGFVLDRLGWAPAQALLDPACGSGTFLLEGLRRRHDAPTFAGADAGRLLAGIYGMDLNPLAVLTARASIVTFIADALDPLHPVQIPVYLADAINSVSATEGVFEHRLQTDRGEYTFQLPESLVRSVDFIQLMAATGLGVNEGLDASALLRQLDANPAVRALGDVERGLLATTLRTLVALHEQKWDGIWCAILAERFAAGAIPRVATIAGNPPWVKWSHLPPEYATFIQPHCRSLGVFSDDVWVGGIEADISTVITYEAVRKWLAPSGRLGFLITGTVFKNQSSQGFRRFTLPAKGIRCRVIEAHDFQQVRPFENANNHPVLFVIERDADLVYPVPYTFWRLPQAARREAFATTEAFVGAAAREDLMARPVPGTDAGPWLVGTAVEHTLWPHIFRKPKSPPPVYQARKGVTTDMNGVFFVKVLDADKTTAKIQNDPTAGRRANIAKITRVVEGTHVFPILRGEDVGVFRAVPADNQAILVPQRGMHGDPDLAATAPKTHGFLNRFADLLAVRSSYRRYQAGQPIWSTWSTGPYTFARFKVVWQEMSGGRFCAAYVGSTKVHAGAPRRVVVPDHKVYFVPLDTEDEAAFLAGLLNATMVRRAISAYATQLSLGVSVVEYLDIPKYDTANRNHAALVTLARTLNNRGQEPTPAEWAHLDRLVSVILGIP